MAEKLSRGKKVDQVGSIRSVIGKVKCVAISKRPFPAGNGGKVAHLPDEVLMQIFRFLDARSLLACASTCRRWELIANDNSLWKELYCAYFDREQPPSSLYVEEKHWKGLSLIHI